MKTAEGLRLLMEGTKGLGEGMSSYAKHGRLSKAAQAVREQVPEDFEGGAPAQEQAAQFTRAGELSAADRLRAKKPEGMENLWVQLTMKGDTEGADKVLAAMSKLKRSGLSGGAQVIYPDGKTLELDPTQDFDYEPLSEVGYDVKKLSDPNYTEEIDRPGFMTGDDVVNKEWQRLKSDYMKTLSSDPEKAERIRSALFKVVDSGAARTLGSRGVSAYKQTNPDDYESNTKATIKYLLDSGNLKQKKNAEGQVEYVNTKTRYGVPGEILYFSKRPGKFSPQEIKPTKKAPPSNDELYNQKLKEFQGVAPETLEAASKSANFKSAPDYVQRAIKDALAARK